MVFLSIWVKTVAKNLLLPKSGSWIICIFEECVLREWVSASKAEGAWFESCRREKFALFFPQSFMDNEAGKS